MKKCALLLLLCFACVFAQTNSAQQLKNFISAKGDKLYDGEKEFRFVSFNMPNLHYIEDNFVFENPNPWRLPTEFEIRDALKTIRLMGGGVTRIYIPSVRRLDESKDVVRYVEGPGKFNEEAFRALDKVFQVANEEGVRIIMPFIDNWWWWGGPIEFSAFRHKDPKVFWNDPVLISDVKTLISYMLNRRNTYTGTLYKDDKAILGWETGNELDAPVAWQHEIASFVHSIDKNHLVIEGIRSTLVTPEEVEDPNFNVMTTHYYNPITQAVKDIEKNKELTRGKKPYFVGEFGYFNIRDTRTIVEAAKELGASGILMWSMRGHNEDGGFYQHAEGNSGSYRFPGFASGSFYDERVIISYLRESAYKWNGLIAPPLPVPDKPEILPIPSVQEISWRGSTGADSYIIQRKAEGEGKWQVIADSVSDGDFPFRPLFSDNTAEPGHSYTYRILAKNASGISEPSAPSKPVKALYKKFADYMAAPGKFIESSGKVDFVVRQNQAKVKQQENTLKVGAGTTLTYKVAASIDSVKVKLFFLNGPVNVHFSICDTAVDYKPVTAKLETFPLLANYYSFYTPAVYTCREFPLNGNTLKIKFDDEAIISQVEIIYASTAAK